MHSKKRPPTVRGNWLPSNNALPAINLVPTLSFVWAMFLQSSNNANVTHSSWTRALLYSCKANTVGTVPPAQTGRSIVRRYIVPCLLAPEAQYLSRSSPDQIRSDEKNK